MTCTTVKLGSNYAIVCSSAPRARTCKCGKRSTKLCDWVIGVGRGQIAMTCDMDLCDGCATHVGPNKDLCPAHAKEWDEHPRNPKNGGPGQVPLPL